MKTTYIQTTILSVKELALMIDAYYSLGIMNHVNINFDRERATDLFTVRDKDRDDHHQCDVEVLDNGDVTITIKKECENSYSYHEVGGKRVETKTYCRLYISREGDIVYEIKDKIVQSIFCDFGLFGDECYPILQSEEDGDGELINIKINDSAYKSTFGQILLQNIYGICTVVDTFGGRKVVSMLMNEMDE